MNNTPTGRDAVNASLVGVILFAVVMAVMLFAPKCSSAQSPNIDSLATTWTEIQSAAAIYASADGDTLTVWYNTSGETAIWRLDYASGVRWARTLTGGTFLVRPETLEALRLLYDPAVAAQFNAINNDAPVTGDPRIEVW